MKNFLTNNLLHIPIYVWLLQLLYVAVALAILFMFFSINQKTTWFVVVYVVVVIIINVIWRMAIK